MSGLKKTQNVCLVSSSFCQLMMLKLFDTVQIVKVPVSRQLLAHGTCLAVFKSCLCGFCSTTVEGIGATDLPCSRYTSANLLSIASRLKAWER